LKIHQDAKELSCDRAIERKKGKFYLPAKILWNNSNTKTNDRCRKDLIAEPRSNSAGE
jgi:hypothetical protein